MSGAGGLRSANLGDEPVASGRHRKDEPGCLGVVAESAAELAHRAVDGIVNIEKHPFTPEALQDLLARHELSTLLDQQEKQVERNTFEF